MSRFPYPLTRRAALLLALLTACDAVDEPAAAQTSEPTTGATADEATGAPLDVDLLDALEQGAGDPEQVTSAYFYDIAEYMAPSCSAPVDLKFNDPYEVRRYVPVGVRNGEPAWIYAKDADKGFEEYTAGRGWIRLWTDTTWAWENQSAPGSFCDETCGAQGVKTSCYHEWDPNSGSPTAYAYLAPREAQNPGLGAKFLPRYIPRDDRAYTYDVSSFLHARKRSDCSACPGNDSWHASPNTAVTIKAVVKHVDAYRGWSDLIMKVTVAGSGKGDRFWYARGYGFVGFEQLDHNSLDMTSIDPTKVKVSSGSFAKSGSVGGTAFPGASRACFGLAQASICQAWNPPQWIPGGQTVSIRARANDLFVTAENAGGSPLIANRPASGAWEKFQIVDLGQGNVALRAGANGKYVCADNSGDTSLIANRPTPGQWEVYRWIDLGNQDFALQSAANGKYVTAENAGGAALIANRDDSGAWERFHWE